MPPKKRTTLTSAQPATRKTTGKRAASPAREPDTARAKRVKTAPNASAAQVPSNTGIPSPNFSGNFDLYGMDLEFLSEVFVNKTGPPKFEELYKKILTYQEKNDRTAQIYLAPPGNPQDTSRFRCVPMQDPMECLPYSIVLESVGHHEELTMPTLSLPSGVPENTCGISALLSLEREGCGFAGSKGTLHLRRAWTKLGDDKRVIELFEGYVSFQTTFSSIYRRKGHGSGQHWQYAFWAVRARVDEKGNEVGLKKDVVHVPIIVGSEEPAKHPITTGDRTPPPMEDDSEDDSDNDSDEDWRDSRYGYYGRGYYDPFDDYEEDC